VNVSEGGISVGGLENPAGISGPVDLRFTMPDGRRMEARGRTVWAEPQGRAGIQFLQMSETDRSALRIWLRQQQAQEGWALPHDSRRASTCN
jgi:predicted Zn-dependent protease